MKKTIPFLIFFSAFFLSANVFAATYVVDNMADTDNGLAYTLADGTNTLRKCIRIANASASANDIINFSAAAVGTITLTSNLPALTGAGVTIDGGNAIGAYVANTNLTGGFSAATNLTRTISGANLYSKGITISSDNNIIKGLNFINVGTVAEVWNDVIIDITSGADNNQILGCYIGTTLAGTGSAGADTDCGVRITDGANNKVGDGTAAGRNLISGLKLIVATTSYGVLITGASATGNTIKGNIIGLQKDGATYLATTQKLGVYIGVSAASNTIGGTVAGEGNVISGNTFIGAYYDASATGNSALGNIIGPQADGISNVASNSQDYGFYINGSPNNSIGGSAAGARNIISGNLTEGVGISGASSTGNSVKGNYIGLDITGTTSIASQGYGVYITTSAASNTIGGTGAGEGNVISGNTTGGIYTGSTAGNTAIGNIIGPQADGSSNVTSNSQDYGISVITSPDNTIGGSATGARNIISANLISGVYIRNAGSTGNLVKGNYIGLDITGTAFIAGSSQDYGVYVLASAASNTIGGSGVSEGNVISGNSDGAGNGKGIYLASAAAAGSSVLGNIIGPQANGTSYVASNAQSYGIWISASPNNTIGGTAGARNIMSANEYSGIGIFGGSTGNVVKGNYIGLDKNGTTFIGGSTQDVGVYISNGASNTIGGTVAGEGNVISGNKDAFSAGMGMDIENATSASNLVTGNIIGPQANGASYVTSNAQSIGIRIIDSPNNIIGGNTAGARNIISANETYGVYIFGAASTGTLVKGNYIGPSSALASIASSNQDYGVYIRFSAANNTIGGSVAGEANTIAFNTVNGVYLTEASTDFNLISRNPIYSNTGKPINLNYGGSSNNDKAIPVITTVNTTTVVGTSSATGDIVEVFKNTTGNCNDAVTFIGFATADATVSHNWSLAVALSNGDYVLATATDGSNNTSEFTPCVGTLPVELLLFDAKCENNVIQLSWTTASETNNAFFTIERSAQPLLNALHAQPSVVLQGGLEFLPIGTVKGAGNSSTIRRYEFIDSSPEGGSWDGALYYRLRQTDFNGTPHLFSPVSVSCSGNSGFSFSVTPNPPLADGNIYVSVNGAANENVLVVLTDVLGREMYSKSIVEQSDGYLFNINLQDKIVPGVYFVTASAKNKYFSKKIVVK